MLWPPDAKSQLIGKDPDAKIESRRRRGQQRMRWLDGITDSMDMSLMDNDMLLYSARITKISKIDNIKCW